MIETSGCIYVSVEQFGKHSGIKLGLEAIQMYHVMFTSMGEDLC